MWQLETQSDAYGLFTSYRSGEPVSVGVEGDSDPGRRLDFWQDRYLIRLFAFQPIANGDLIAAGKAVAVALPRGGDLPALLERLPSHGRVDGSERFFHQEISIQDRLWLGGEDLLRLSPETDGVVADYETQAGTAQLLIVEYPDPAIALAAWGALDAASPADLADSDLHENLLGAVFGRVSAGTAGELLSSALRTE